MGNFRNAKMPREAIAKIQAPRLYFLSYSIQLSTTIYKTKVLTFMSWIKSMHSWVWYKKNFITSGSDIIGKTLVYDQEMPQSQITDQIMAPRRRDTRTQTNELYISGGSRGEFRRFPPPSHPPHPTPFLNILRKWNNLVWDQIISFSWDI